MLYHPSHLGLESVIIPFETRIYERHQQIAVAHAFGNHVVLPVFLYW